MSSSRRPGRRIPPKARGPRPAPPPAREIDDDPGMPDVGATGPYRPGTRAANRAAKRATSPRPVPRGRTRGGRRQSGFNPAVLVLAIGAVVIGAAVLAFGSPLGAPAGSPTPVPTAAVYGDGTCPTSQPPALAAGDAKLVTLETEFGDIVVKVDPALAPIAGGNFVALATCQYFDGLVFHRTAALEDGTPFVIQGGDPNGDGSGGPGYTIKDETVTATYKRGTVAMARSAGVDTQGSQFFIVLDDKAGPILVSNGNNYTIFGEVVSGMEVADTIFASSEGEELPTDPVVMTSVTVAPVPAASGSPAPSGSASQAPPSASAPSQPSPTAVTQ